MGRNRTEQPPPKSQPYSDPPRPPLTPAELRKGSCWVWAYHQVRLHRQSADRDNRVHPPLGTERLGAISSGDRFAAPGAAPRAARCAIRVGWGWMSASRRYQRISRQMACIRSSGIVGPSWVAAATPATFSGGTTARNALPRPISRISRLVAKMTFLTWTSDGLLRHVVFRGLSKIRRLALVQLRRHWKAESALPVDAGDKLHGLNQLRGVGTLNLKRLRDY